MGEDSVLHGTPAAVQRVQDHLPVQRHLQGRAHPYVIQRFHRLVQRDIGNVHLLRGMHPVPVDVPVDKVFRFVPQLVQVQDIQFSPFKHQALFHLVRDIEQFHAVTARSAAHSSAFAPFCEYSTIPRLLLSWVSGLSGFLCGNIIFSLLQQLFSAFPAGPARLDFSQRIW